MSLAAENQYLEIDGNIILKDVCEKNNLEICYSKSGTTKETLGCKRKNILTWSQLDYLQSLIKDIFLPQGYPESVSSDYLEYQLWDTCQAFCSSISGTLSMSAVMEGVGVGSDTATPVSAAITWIMKDGTGMVGSILFAWSKGYYVNLMHPHCCPDRVTDQKSRLDSDCKKWRLFADVLNDAAMCLELYIPYVKHLSMYLLCISTAMKALVGVAGSATRAALTCHQAIQGNMADVSAKDGSQEIFVNLCAYIFGIFLLKNVTEPDKIWTVMAIFIVLHLYSNYRAVTCLKINVYNGERYRLIMRSFLATSDVATVEQVNRIESVTLGFGTREREIFGYDILMGASLDDVLSRHKITANDLMFLVVMFQSKNYLLLPDMNGRQIFVSFRKSFSDLDVLKGYFHAVLAAAALGLTLEPSGKRTLPFVKRRRKNSPVFRLEKVLKEFSSEKKLDMYKSEFLPVPELLGCEQIIEREFALFCKLSREQEWNLNKNLLHLDDWRAEWKYVKEKKIPTPVITNSKRVTPMDLSTRPKPSIT